MQVVRKYKLARAKEGEFLSPNPLDGIIEFKVDGKVTLKKGAFLTTNKFHNLCSIEARDFLAITYPPRYEYEWKQDEFGVCKFENPYANSEPTRIWPAFGHHGGAYEILLTEGSLGFKEPGILTFDDAPEAPDSLWLDSTQSNLFSPFSYWWVEEIYNCLSRMVAKLSPYNEYKLAGKILDGLGTVISWIEDGWRYTISCAFKDLKEKNGRPKMIVQFWGYVWQDKENEKIRSLSMPIVRCHIFDFERDEFTEHPEASRIVDRFLKEIVDDDLKKIKDFPTLYNQIPLLPAAFSECQKGKWSQYKWLN